MEDGKNPKKTISVSSGLGPLQLTNETSKEIYLYGKDQDLEPRPEGVYGQQTKTKPVAHEMLPTDNPPKPQ